MKKKLLIAIKNHYPSVVLALFIFIGSINAQQIQNLENRFQLAQSYEQAGQLNKAEAIYRELSQLQSWNAIYTEALNRVLVSQKKYSESIELLENKIKLQPADINLYGLLGSTYFIMDQSQKAFDVWERGVAINPASIVGYRIITNYALTNRAFEKAIDFLQRGRKYSDDPSIFSLDLANIYAVNMKFKEAAAEFCSLIAAHPEQVQVVKARMNSYLKGHGAVEQTIEAIKDFVDSKPMLQLYELLTFVYQSGGNYKDAFENVIKTEEIFNGNGSYIFIFAQDAYRNRQFEWAASSYDYILKNYKNSPYITTAKIGYARTLEAALDQKFLTQNKTWKPIYTQRIFFPEEYKKIINTYENFTSEFPDNASRVEALFRIAEIYRNRLFDYNRADSTYNLVSIISPLSNYYIQSNISRGKIAVARGDLRNAKLFFESAAKSNGIDPNDLAGINFYLARIEFWKGNFTASLTLLNEVTINLSTDFANDALELTALINSAKKDSLNLLIYSHADMLLVQNKVKEAVVEFKTLSDNHNLFVINDFAKNKLAELFIAEEDFSDAVKLLETSIGGENSGIFAEKSLFLLAKCYQYGTKDLLKAAETYQKLLEIFPNSLYFDRAREALQSLSTNNG